MLFLKVRMTGICAVAVTVLVSFPKFTGIHLYGSLFFNKAVGWNPATLFKKKRLWYRCFLVNFAKFLRTYFSQNTFGQVLLKILAFLTKAEAMIQ